MFLPVVRISFGHLNHPEIDNQQLQPTVVYHSRLDLYSLQQGHEAQPLLSLAHTKLEHCVLLQDNTRFLISTLTAEERFCLTPPPSLNILGKMD